MTTQIETHITIFTASENPEAMAAARDVRQTVFILEQKVMPEDEWDEHDQTATHFLLKDKVNGNVIGTGRITEYQQGCQTQPVAKLGRIALLEAYRGSGLGKLLVEAMVAEAKRQGYGAAYLHGQSYARDFYAKLGFEAEGFEFDEAGIPHIAMRCVFQ